MKSSDAARPLYLETNTSSISHRAGLLQLGDGMNIRHDEMLYNSILQTNAYTRKSFSSVE